MTILREKVLQAGYGLQDLNAILLFGLFTLRIGHNFLE